MTRDGEPVTGYVRLLDSTGEFTAEVPTSATGQFRFYAAEGEGGWWVLGDNAYAGGDSTDYGVVPDELILGKALLRYPPTTAGSPR